MFGEAFPRVLEQAKVGDTRAVEVVYRELSPLILGYLRANHVRDAEDRTGDVFVSMIHGLSGFRGDEQGFRSWLLNIAQWHVLAAQRHGEPFPDLPIPMDARHRGAAEGVAAAFARLSGLEREVLSLSVLADLSIEGIAEVVERPPAAVRAVLRRASASLGNVVPSREDGRELLAAVCGSRPDGGQHDS